MIESKEYEAGMCEECNNKIKVYMGSLRKTQLALMTLKPKKFATKMASLICDSCRKKIQNKLKRGV